MQDSIYIQGNQQYPHVFLVSIVKQLQVDPYHKGYLLTVDATSGEPLDIKAVGDSQAAGGNSMNP